MDENSIESNNHNNNEELSELNQISATKKPACDYCKRRKIKCDSNQPCFQCSKRGIDCEYILPASKPKTGVVAKLIKKVDQLSAKLAEQKKIADYWRNLYEDKESHVTLHGPILSENKRQIVSPRPMFSESTQEFCSNVLAAVSSIRKAFLDVMKAMMPLNTLEYDVEYASIFWNRLIGTEPADLVANIKNTTTTNETIVQMVLHSSIFSLGSILLIDTIDEDLAVHFNQCFNALFTIVSQIHIPSLQYETMKQMTLSLLYTMFYYKINGYYNEITSIWQLTSSLLISCKPGLDNESFAEFTLCLVLLDPTRGFDSTIPLDFSGSNQYHYIQPQRQILQVVSKVVLALTRNKMDPEHNSYVWNCIKDVETKLTKLQQPYYEFFGAWIYSLKSIFAAYMHGHIHEEINKCITIALKLYNGITNGSEQAWLSRDLEYLHFILSKSQAQLQEKYSLNVVLGALYNIITQMSPTENACIKAEPSNTNSTMENYAMSTWTYSN